jgi:hypothetical protein
MPFTVSHAAAVLPLHRLSRHLPLTALMIGSMAPDFGYFFLRDAPRHVTHSFPGLFTFSLPVGLVGWLFYIAVLEKTTITLLPDRWHTRFAHTDAITPSLVLRACIAIVLGAITHLIWDAFTHRHTFITDTFPVLYARVPGMRWLPIYHLLQGVTSVIGLLILANWARHLHRQPAKSQIRPYEIREPMRIAALWFLGVASVVTAFVDWWPLRRAGYDTQIFYSAVGLMSGFFVAWCCIAAGLWLQARRNRRAP